MGSTEEEKTKGHCHSQSININRLKKKSVQNIPGFPAKKVKTKKENDSKEDKRKKNLKKICGKKQRFFFFFVRKQRWWNFSCLNAGKRIPGTKKSEEVPQKQSRNLQTWVKASNI